MPVPEERLYQPERINRWFAVSSVLMTLSIVWFIKADYQRPWREFQDQFYLSKAAMAHLDFLDATREEKLQEIEEARRRLEDVRQYVAETSAARRVELEQELAEADLQFRRAEGPWSRLRQLLDVTKDSYERALETFGSNHPQTVEAHQTFRAQQEEFEQRRKEKEHWEDRRNELERQLRELDQPIRDAEVRLRELEQVAQSALERGQQFRGVLTDDGLLGGLPIVSWIVNMPLLDFTAPKNTPARHQVNQLVLPDIRQELNYLETYTTDRCTTCHVAIDDPEFSKDRLASKLERSLAGINDELQRNNRDPLDPPTPPVVWGDPLPPGRVTEFWGRLSRTQQDDYFEALLAIVNRYLKQGGRKQIELGEPLLAHPNLDLFVTVDSPHPMASMGCTVCHEGNPQETDFVQAAHSPPTHEIAQLWKEKYYVRELGIPNITFETIEHYWDRPMRLPQYTEAGCAKCHTQITDVAQFEGERVGVQINLGEHLYREVGCINCHNVDDLADSRKVGPDLSRIAAKLSPDFVEPWILAPKKFRPSTHMPHFFHEENNRDASANNFDPHPELRTETEVISISEYLYTVSREWKPLEKPADVVGDVERGRALFKNVGCLACHANEAEFGEDWITEDLVHRTGLDRETARFRYKGMTHDERIRYAMKHFTDARLTFLEPDKARDTLGDGYRPPVFSRYAPELSGIGSKVSAEWLYSWLLNPAQFAPDTKMPNMRLAPDEAADLTAYLMSLRQDGFRQGEVELTQERRDMVDTLVFDLISAQRSERRTLAIMDDKDDELTQMLVSLIAPSLGQDEAYERIRPLSVEDKRLVFLGNKMILHYGCYACHTIAGFEEASPPGTDLSTWAEKPISQLDFAFYDHAFHHMREERDDVFGYIYPRDAEDLNELSPLPDDAREQITHTHHAFAKHKMLNPRIWDRNKLKKPYDKLKMPNFHFTEDEAEALTTYLLSRKPPRVSDAMKINYPDSTKGPIAEGRFLTRELNCIACHYIEDNVPTINQYFRRTMGGETSLDVVNAPPSLRGEGAKIQHQWFHRFLQQVEPLRPWLQVRMPSFQLTSDQATTLAAYFAALSREDSAKLAEAMAPIREYREQQGADEAENEAGALWWRKDSLRKPTGRLRRFGIERELVREADFDPLRVSEDRVRNAHRDLLERVAFLRKLYDVEYPFVEPPAPMASSERFERGMNFLVDMGCLKCHVLGPMLPGPAHITDDFVQMYRLDGVRGEGDEAVAILNGTPYKIGDEIDGHTLVSAERIFYPGGDVDMRAVVEGPNAEGEIERVLLVAPSAPNLSLTYERLQRTWVHDWMLNPQWIQPGTKMPQNFPGGVSPFEGDPQYPGTGEDHINLLVDTLYDAGRSNARAPLPKITVTEPSDEFLDDDDGFFDD
jgi:cbb3-type cytochrome oxidase cytochrome c subunit